MRPTEGNKHILTGSKTLQNLIKVAWTRFLQHLSTITCVFEEGARNTTKTNNFSLFSFYGRFGHSRSRGVQKMKSYSVFLERETFFSEKMLQTRAGDGGAHRIPRNVERIENGCRQHPGRGRPHGPHFPSQAGQR